MPKTLQRLCFILITFLLSASSYAHAFSFQHVTKSHFSATASTNVNSLHVAHKSILSIDAVLYEPSSITNNFDAIEEVIEEDEDTECASFKKQSDNNTQFCISQKAFQKAGAYHFYSPKSWQTQAPIVASTSTSKSILFCVFRI